jgi:hypothetical protein
MSLIADILDDISAFEPIEISLPEDPIENNSSVDQKFFQYYHLVQRFSRLKKRELTLYYAYKVGQLLETQTTSRAQRMLFKTEMTTHFYLGCIRTYHIFFNM